MLNCENYTIVLKQPSAYLCKQENPLKFAKNSVCDCKVYKLIVLLVNGIPNYFKVFYFKVFYFRQSENCQNYGSCPHLLRNRHSRNRGLKQMFLIISFQRTDNSSFTDVPDHINNSDGCTSSHSSHNHRADLGGECRSAVRGYFPLPPQV